MFLPNLTLTSHKFVFVNFLKYSFGIKSESLITLKFQATFCACLSVKESKNSSIGDLPFSVQ